MTAKSVQLSYKTYLSADLTQFVGKWVAVNKDGVAASSKTMAGLIKLINEKGLKDSVITQVRNEEELMIL